MNAHRPGTDAPAAAPDRDAERTRNAWLAHTRQELLAPAGAIREVVAMLLLDADERGPEAFVADLRKINDAAERLLVPLKELLDPACETAGTLDREARHRLRTPLNHILGYCELWIEDAEAQLLDGFVGDLRKVHGLARGLLGRLDGSARLVKSASDQDMGLDAAGLPEMIRDVVGSAPALTGGGRKCAEKGRVLIVDDNEDNRDVLRRWLLRDGHAIEEAGDGLQALEKAAAVPFDLILLDIIMPRVNGIEALARLKADARLHHIPVVMISAFDEVDTAVRCIELGAEDYLPKPCNPVLLRARVGACLEKKLLRDREAVYLEQIRREKERVDELLHVILPSEVVPELIRTGAVQPRRVEGVAVLFADIVGFTPYCGRHTPEVVVAQLQRVMQAWEDAAVSRGVQKIKTIGDAFMAAAGLLRPAPDDPVLCCVRLGMDMIETTRRLAADWDLRVGVHVGPVVSGVVGRRQYLFDIWGETVNTAARMESHGEPGRITLSLAAWEHAAPRCEGLEFRKKVKGMGDDPQRVFQFVQFINP
jgi:adenylate cyclase